MSAERDLKEQELQSRILQKETQLKDQQILSSRSKETLSGELEKEFSDLKSQIRLLTSSFVQF